MSKSEKPRVLRGNARELNMRKIHLTVTQIILSVSKASIIDIFSVWFNTTKFLIFSLFFLPCCSCPVSQLWNISLYRFVSFGPPKSITSISSFSALNSVCVYTSQSWPGIPGSLSHIPIRLSAPSCVQNLSLQCPMAFCFQTQWSIHGAHLCNLPTPADHLLIHPLPLASRTPLSWFSDFADCFFSALFSGATSKCQGPRGAVLRPPLLTTLTYLFLKWSYPSLMALNGIYRLITLNFIQNADLYFQLPIKCLYLRDE